MPPADNKDALAAATRRRSQQARARARDAIQQLDRDGTPITFTAVADAAGVSRSLLYRDPTLRNEIQQLREQTSPRQIPHAQQASEPSLQRRIEALLEDNARLRDDNRKLRARLALHLGRLRTQHTPQPPPDLATGSRP